MIVEAAKMVKTWFNENTALSVESVKIQIEQQRAGSYLSYQDRAVNDAAPADLEQIMQSANVMSEPRSLARLYIADKCGIPIVPVVLSSSLMLPTLLVLLGSPMFVMLSSSQPRLLSTCLLSLLRVLGV